MASPRRSPRNVKSYSNNGFEDAAADTPLSRKNVNAARSTKIFTCKKRGSVFGISSSRRAAVRIRDSVSSRFTRHRIAVRDAIRLCREDCGTLSNAATASSTSPSCISCRANPKADDTVVGFAAHTNAYKRMAWKRSIAGLSATIVQVGSSNPSWVRLWKKDVGTSASELLKPALARANVSSNISLVFAPERCSSSSSVAARASFGAASPGRISNTTEKSRCAATKSSCSKSTTPEYQW